MGAFAKAKDRLFLGWAKFKRGMMQVNFVITILNVSLSAFTALFLALSGLIPIWCIVLFVLCAIAGAALAIWKFGKWDWNPNNPRTIYRRDMQSDPWAQTVVKFDTEVCKKLGIDPSIFDEWRKEEKS